MKTAGIICEYNPFHTGHLYQFARLREAGFDRIVCLMSGNFVQRGEPALFPRRRRAEGAMACGADLVLELPFPYSCASADFFAGAGVRILSRIGIDAICFGTETEDTGTLQRIADAIAREEFTELLCKESAAHPNLGSTAVYARAVERLVGTECPTAPNDLLAIAYLRAMKREGVKFDAFPVLRNGCGYSESRTAAGKHPSATALRKLISDAYTVEENPLPGLQKSTLYDSLTGFVPPQALDILLRAVDEGEGPVFPDVFGELLLPSLRLAVPEVIGKRAECEGGLGERLLSAAKSATTYRELLSAVATKKYTDARIRRAILFATIGVGREELDTPPAFVNVLAANKLGCSLLADVKKTNRSSYFVSKPADLPNTEAAKRQAEAGRCADALYTLAMPKKRDGGWFIRQSPIISGD